MGFRLVSGFSFVTVHVVKNSREDQIIIKYSTLNPTVSEIDVSFDGGKFTIVSLSSTYARD